MGKQHMSITFLAFKHHQIVCNAFKKCVKLFIFVNFRRSAHLFDFWLKETTVLTNYGLNAQSKQFKYVTVKIQTRARAIKYRVISWTLAFSLG